MSSSISRDVWAWVDTNQEVFYRVVITWGFIELLFYFYVRYIIYPRRMRLTTPPPPFMPPFQLIMRVLDHLAVLESYVNHEYFRGFFHGADIPEVYVDNLRSFLAWAMYASKYPMLSVEQSANIDAVIRRVEGDFNHKFTPGFNPRVKHFQMTLDPIVFYHRPLLVYAITALSNILGYISLRLCGFESRRIGVVHYWYRPAESEGGNNTSDNTSQRPIVFFHGITPGWLVYLPFVFAIIGNRPTLLIDLDTIKINSLAFDMPKESDFVDSVTKAIDAHFGTAAKVSVVGHSFGTISSAWFLRHRPDRISHLTLIDPVSLLLGLPDVAYNFLHKSPDTLSKLIIRLIASREITVSNMLHRHFWWYNNILFLEDIPSHINVVVGLPGRDEIANNKVVLDYVRLLQTAPNSPIPPGITANTNNGSAIIEEIRSKRTGGGIEVLYWPEATHASVLFNIYAQREIVNLMKRSERGKDSGH